MPSWFVILAPPEVLNPTAGAASQLKYGIHYSCAEQHTNGRTPMIEAPKSRKYGDSRLKLLLAPATIGPTASATSNTTVLATMVRVWDAGFAIVADTVPELAPK